MSIVRLFAPPASDSILSADLAGWKFYIAYVTGVGECPHRHRLEKQAEQCMRKMRHWLDLGPTMRDYRRRPW